MKRINTYEEFRAAAGEVFPYAFAAHPDLSAPPESEDAYAEWTQSAAFPLLRDYFSVPATTSTHVDCVMREILQSGVLDATPATFATHLPAWRDFLRLYKGYWDVPTSIYNALGAELCTKVVPHFPLGEAFENRPMIAFYASEADRQRDRVTVTKVGRFLGRMGLSNETIKAVTTVYKTERGIFDEYELKFATRGDDIFRVYANGPSSCMHGYNDGVRASPHPVYVYESPDIAVAYIEAPSSSCVLARAVCNEVNKQYPIAYGNEEMIEAKLSELGYEKNTEALHGARLALLYDDTYDEIICPYVDRGGQSIRIDRQNGWLIVDPDGEYEADRTSGFLDFDPEEEEYRVCDSCGTNIYGDGGVYSPYHEQLYCESCADEYWVEAITHTMHTSHGLGVFTDQVDLDECIYDEAEGRYVVDDSRVVNALAIEYSEHHDVYASTTHDYLVHSEWYDDWLIRRQAVQARCGADSEDLDWAPINEIGGYVNGKPVIEDIVDELREQDHPVYPVAAHLARALWRAAYEYSVPRFCPGAQFKDEPLLPQLKDEPLLPYLRAETPFSKRHALARDFYGLSAEFERIMSKYGMVYDEVQRDWVLPAEDNAALEQAA